MEFKLPPLPYPKDALDPHISSKTLSYHYEKHHHGYMKKLEKNIAGTTAAEKTLEELICSTKDENIYNLAAQVWNHTFYWHCMMLGGGGSPSEAVLHQINHHFGSFEKFKDQFSDAASKQFGSGWAWLVKDNEHKLKIIKTSNAHTPLSIGFTPLLTLDVWEHAYYLDYQNDRNHYIDNFFKHLINWEFVEKNMKDF